MKMKLLKQAVFWLCLISVVICLADFLGSGLANIALIHFNPAVNAMIAVEPYRHWMIDANNGQWASSSILLKVRFPAYPVHFGSFMLAGVLIDSVRRVAKIKLV